MPVIIPMPPLDGNKADINEIKIQCKNISSMAKILLK